MKKIRVYLQVDDMVGEDVIEIPDDLTEYEIDDIVYDSVMEHVGWSWEEVE